MQCLERITLEHLSMLRTFQRLELFDVWNFSKGLSMPKTFRSLELNILKFNPKISMLFFIYQWPFAAFQFAFVLPSKNLPSNRFSFQKFAFKKANLRKAFAFKITACSLAFA